MKLQPVPKDSLEVPASRALADGELPRVGIVILNWNGRGHLSGCFESLAALDYPRERFEVVLVDNGSSDGSAEFVRSKFDWVRLLQNERNVGFSAGCNQGAREASEAEVLVFLNNDIRVEPAFLRELVAPIVARDCEATTARMLSWDGKRMNSAGGGMNFYGVGIQRGYEEAPGAEFDAPCLTLFACGGAMAMDAEVYAQVGGFDEEFFAYYEDVDLGWRTWVLGYSVRYVPSAVCYHHHSSTSSRVPPEHLRVIQVRNPLLACFKNYDDPNLEKVLPAMLALATRRTYLGSGLRDADAFRIERLGAPGRAGRLARLWRRLRRMGQSEASTSRIALADLIAINDLIGQWDHWMERRQQVQKFRRRPDAEIFPLFLRPLWCIEGDYGYQELQRGITGFLGIDRLFAGLTRMDRDPAG